MTAGGPPAGGTPPGGGPPESGAPPGGGDGAASTANGEIPTETAGPFPGDGSNGVNVLTESGIVRSDITTSFGSGSAVAAGVPLTIRLKVLDTAKNSAALTGAAVYLWHCNIDGEYSLYSEAIADENYLRGVQETDANGEVTFVSIFPAAYSGRWPHIHFEVYESLNGATSATTKLRTSQLALPKDACAEVYATDGYSQSVTNLAQTSLDTDMVFADGYSRQLGRSPAMSLMAWLRPSTFRSSPSQYWLNSRRLSWASLGPIPADGVGQAWATTSWLAK